MKSLSQHINEWKASNNTIQNIVDKEELFIYNVSGSYNSRIKIFSKYWKQLDDYINKVYIDGEHCTINKHGITEMSYKPGLHEVTIEDINNVINCSEMFWGCNQLIGVPLFDTSKVTNMIDMFWQCNQIESIPGFNTKNVKSMKQMFRECKKLKNVPLFDTENVENMDQMFFDCWALDDETKKQWSQIYDFNKESKK